MYPKIFDGHNDTLTRVFRAEGGVRRSFFEEDPFGHLDLKRAKKAGFGGGLFAIFVPTLEKTDESHYVVGDNGVQIPIHRPIDSAYAARFTLDVLGNAFRIEEQSEGAITIVTSYNELTKAFDHGSLAMVLHCEGAEVIDTELHSLEVLYRAGLRSLGLVWSRPNSFAEGVPFKCPQSPDVGKGLSAHGKALVRRCNELGIIVDLSHLNAKGFYDVASISVAPLVASHSAVHAICPSARNLTDDQLKTIALTKGIVGMNFNVADIRRDGRREADTPAQEIAFHIDYVVQLIGIDHVGLGSDFDGAMMPNEVGDVSGTHKIIDHLRKMGYDETAIEAVCFRNWFRICQQTWR